MKNRFFVSRKNQARSAFTLTELIFMLVVICILGAFAMPPIYRTRLTRNEESARETLQMLHSAQVSWKQRTGSWARLHLIAYAPGPPSDLEPFLPFIHANEDGVAYLGGYRYSQTLNANGIPYGCFADPITPHFSGRLHFDLNYETGEVVEMAGLDAANNSKAF
jgi:type II secretory pathway pseudopilin PulG